MTKTEEAHRGIPLADGTPADRSRQQRRTPLGYIATDEAIKPLFNQDEAVKAWESSGRSDEVKALRVAGPSPSKEALDEVFKAQKAAARRMDELTEIVRLAIRRGVLALHLVKHDGTLDLLHSDFTDDAFVCRQSLYVGASRENSTFGETLCFKQTDWQKQRGSLGKAWRPRQPDETLNEKPASRKEIEGWTQGEMVHRAKSGKPKDRDTMVLVIKDKFSVTREVALSVWRDVPGELKGRRGPKRISGQKEESPVQK